MSERRIITRADLANTQLRTVEVECEELGGTVILRELSVKQMRNLRTNKGIEDDIAAQLSLMIVDESGQLMFDDPDGVAMLSGLRAGTALRLLAAGKDLNVDAEHAVEEVTKNSKASTNGGSGTA